MALASGAMALPEGRKTPRCIEAVYTTATPCGSCRQFLLEFATEDCMIYIDDQMEGPEIYRFQDLLPRPFTAEKQLAVSGHVSAGDA